jgi:3-deoxy-manno-octulosonate cytidylyltransferase (CMP-KDO synthetase)
MKVVGIIPSRYSSSRFPGKPLANILGKSMIQRVYEQCKKCPLLDDVIVATDDKRIYKHVIGFGAKAMMTSNTHQSGTERCNEVAQKIKINYDVIVNIQGDEPCINPKQIEQIISLFDNDTTQIGTLAKKVKDIKIVTDKNNPKAIFDTNGVALNFCRTITNATAENEYFKHIGIYGYLTETLAEICELSPSKNEIKECLEQLRWLDNGYKIKVGITTFESLSVDTPEDIIKIEAQIR